MKFELSFEDYQKLRQLLMAQPATDVYELLIKLDSQIAGQIKIKDTEERPSISMARSGGE